MNLKLFGWIWFALAAINTGVAVVENDATPLGLAGIFFSVSVLLLWEGYRES